MCVVNRWEEDINILDQMSFIANTNLSSSSFSPGSSLDHLRRVGLLDEIVQAYLLSLRHYQQAYSANRSRDLSMMGPSGRKFLRLKSWLDALKRFTEINERFVSLQSVRDVVEFVQYYK